MLVDIPPIVIQSFLQEGGMPSALVQQCAIEGVAEGALSITFKIDSPEGVYYLKFHESEGARGAYVLKHLLPVCDLERRDHAEKRRHFVRKLLDSVIAQRGTLVSQPCYFDLKPFPMSQQKLRKHTEQIVAEKRVEGESYPQRLIGMVGTLWKEMAMDHIPTLSPERKDVWNPVDYRVVDVFRCAAGIGEFQNKAEQFLAARLQRKIAEGKGPVEQVQQRLMDKLQHEQRALQGYDLLVDEFLAAFGLSELSTEKEAKMHAYGQKVLEQVEARVLERGGPSVAELQERFRESVVVPEEYAKISFQKLLFTAERERWWTSAQLNEGKALDQLHQAETIARELMQDPTRILSLVQEVLDFRETYARLESLPQSIVPQDAHPFNFFTHQADGEVAMLDLEDVSMGVRFADLSTVYVFKILRAVVHGRMGADEAKDYLKAVIDGYNSTASTPLRQEELELMAQYGVGVCLNFLPQFGVILRTDPKELDAYNLGMSVEAFIQQFHLLKDIARLWDVQVGGLGLSGQKLMKK